MPGVELLVLASLEDGGYRPIIDIVVTVGSRTETVRALVDTGADMTVLDRVLVEAMAGQSLDDIPGDATTMTGIGGSKIPAKVIAATATYGGRQFATKVVAGDSPRSAVVGRSDFLTRFNARFYWNRNPPEFFLDPADPPGATRSRGARNPTIRPRRRR